MGCPAAADRATRAALAPFAKDRADWAASHAVSVALVAKLEREIDRLFEVPLEEFTPKRNELVRHLKKERDKDGAGQVAALAKPTVPTWVINQLARREKAKVSALLQAGAKLRKAQGQALAGSHADALRGAQVEERQAVRDLTQRAQQILTEAGRPASRAILERISATLGAAAVTEPARSALKAGRLTSEVRVSGFDALAGIELGTQPAAASGDELAERRQQKASRERQRRKLEKNARELGKRAEAAERKAERAEEAAANARELAEEQRRAADAAAAELADFEKAAN